MATTTRTVTRYHCEVCDKDVPTNGRPGHERSKAHKAKLQGFEEILEPVKVVEPAGLRNIHGTKNYKLTPGFRSLKMAYPICPVERGDGGLGLCQRQDQGAPGWWYRCEARGHNPYFSPPGYVYRETEDLGPADAEGNREVIGTKRVRVKTPGGANLRQVPYTGRHTGDENTAIRQARGEGCRFPEEVGLLPFCQFWDCWVQIEYANRTDVSPGGGTFCDPSQAKVARADKAGMFLEVLNETKKKRQWDAIPA